MQIFGITFDDFSCKESLACCEAWLTHEGFHRIATVNPEFLLRARKDTVFARNLRLADLRIIDGFGIVVVGWLRGKRMHRCPGADLMESLLAHAERKNYPIFFAVRRDGLSSYEEVKRVLGKKYPSLMVHGSMVDTRNQALAWNDTYRQIQTSRAKIVLSNFGAPEQEYFTEGLRKYPGDVRLAIGIGGSLDYLTGKILRAPRCVRAMGLEWFWRLMRQPKRVGRIWRATIVFLFKSILEK